MFRGRDFSSVRARNGRVVFRGGSATAPGSIVLMDVESQKTEVLKQATDRRGQSRAGEAISPGRKPSSFPTASGKTAFGLYYPAFNPDYAAPEGDRPPLLVKCHGGPTSAASSTLDLRIQFWTCRGIAVLDVNYGGSTGYGREYRERLDANWGIVDVDDCVEWRTFSGRAGNRWMASVASSPAAARAGIRRSRL